MTLEDHVYLAAYLIFVGNGSSDAEADGHELNRDYAYLAILRRHRIMLVDFVQKLDIRVETNANTVNEENGQPCP